MNKNMKKPELLGKIGGGYKSSLRKGKNAILLVIVFSALIIIAGVTYAWFSGFFVGEGREFSVTTARLGIVYTDGPDVSANNILPGGTIVKTFTVENTASDKTTYEIYMKDFINTFVNNELVYTLTEEVKGVLVSETEFLSTMSIEDTLKKAISINPGEIHTYTLTIKFLETGSNQNSNMGAIFSGTIQVRESVRNDLELAITIDGEVKEDLPKSGVYNLVSYNCANHSALEWNKYASDLLVRAPNFPEMCSLDFESVSLGYTSEAVDKILSDNTLKQGLPDFSKISSTSDTGIYKDEDDYGVSYYFRGDKDKLNNNVVFGGYQWKIIRITGKGDIKLIYNGVCASTPCTINDTGAQTQLASTSAFNNLVTGDNRYVGYMRGNTCTTYASCHANNTNSTIKIAVDNWYNTSTISTSSKANLIADTIYCGDRELFYGTGVSTVITVYSSYSKVVSEMPRPKLKCPQKNDAFTVSDTAKGNGSLTYPVGLITAEETVMAGAKNMNINNALFLNGGQSYWTMSPSQYQTIYEIPHVFYIGTTVGLSNNYTNIAHGVRPVLAIKSNITLTGNGSTSNPYVVQE